MLSTVATEIKNLTFSDDGKEATFILVTKYSGEIAVTLPAAKLEALQLPAKIPSEDGKRTGAKVDANQPTTDRTIANVTVSVPKSWCVVGDAQRRLVIVVLNPTTPAQSGFALNPQMANQLADALVKKSEVVVTSGPATK